MKTAGLHLLAFMVTGTLVAQDPVPAPPAGTSSRLKEEIRAGLPAFTPPPPKVLDQPHGSSLEVDPDLFALPKFTVKEKRPPGHDPDLWLSDRAVQQKAMAAYKQSMTDLEWALNGWFIPLVSAPPSVRARQRYESGKALADLQRVHDLLAKISTLDAKAAADLEQERIKMDQSDYWRSRPAGDGRAK